jgi:hypothetical protein
MLLDMENLFAIVVYAVFMIVNAATGIAASGMIEGIHWEFSGRKCTILKALVVVIYLAVVVATYFLASAMVPGFLCK